MKTPVQSLRAALLAGLVLLPSALLAWSSQLLSKNAAGEFQYNTVNLGGKNWNLGDFDFSYVGYRYGTAAYGTGVNQANIVNITASSGSNITTALQNAINTVGTSGGGVVKIPSGTFLLSAKVNVAHNNVIIRGNGNGATILRITSAYSDPDDFSNGTITFSGSLWRDSTTATTTVSSTIPLGSRSATVASASGFNVGDYIVIQQLYWTAFRNLYSAGNWPSDKRHAFSYYRQIVAKSGNTLTLDIPIAHELNPANNSITVSAATGQRHNVGIEDLRINVDANTNGGTAIMFKAVVNGWAKNVSIHNIGRQGIGAKQASSVTFDNILVHTAQRTTGGGWGYAFNIDAQNILVKNCETTEVRHGFLTANALANNIVIVDCYSHHQNPDGATPTDDTHDNFVHAILWDRHTGRQGAGIAGVYRGSLSSGAYTSLGWGICWNYDNDGTDPDGDRGGEITLTPGEYALIVAPHGGVKVYNGYTDQPFTRGVLNTNSATHVATASGNSNFTSTKVYCEGIGRTDLLDADQSSLYYLQLAKRNGDPGTLVDENFEDSVANGWTVESGTWSFLTDGTRVYRTASTDPIARSFVGPTYGADYSVETKLKVSAWGSSTARSAGLMARYRDANNYYLFIHDNGSLVIRKKVGGTFTTLATKAKSLALGTTYTFEARLFGSSLTFLVDGTQELAATDTALTNGRVGLLSAYADARYDDFNALTTMLVNENFADGVADGWMPETGTWSIFLDGTNTYRSASADVIARTVVGETTWGDYTAESRVKVAAWGNATFRTAGLLAHYQDADNYYLFIHDNGSLQIRRKVGGTLTTLASKAHTLALGTSYLFKAELSGATLRFFIDGVQELTATDTTLQAGKAGLVSAYADARYDDVKVSIP